MDLRFHLARDDVREGRLAEAGGAEDQHVIQRVATAPGRLQEDRQFLAHGRLTDVLVKGLRAQAGLNHPALR